MIDDLIKFDENTLSKEVLIPLLRKIYNCNVDFTGGAPEKGRDLIVYRTDSLSGNDYIGIQVKKIKATANSTTNSFQQLLTQISQMKSEGVIDPATAERVFFRQLIFITPYPINDRAVDSHSGALKKVIDEGVTIIDGIKLESLIKLHAPELIKSIVGDKSFLFDSTLPSLTNKSLMEALSFKEVRELCDIFCDTGFVVTNRMVDPFSNTYSSNESISAFTTTARHLNNLIEHCHILFETLGVEFIESDLLRKAKHKSDNRKALELRYDTLSSEIRNSNKRTDSIIVQSQFRNSYPEHSSSKDLSEFYEKGCFELDIKDFDFISEVVVLKEINDTLKSLRAELKYINKQIEDSKYYIFKINSEDICISINKKKEELKSLIETAGNDLQYFLTLSKNIQCAAGVLHQYESTFLITKNTENDNILTPNITLRDVFDSNLNTIVLGEAGSGKTTNLQVYARHLYQSNKENLIIYMTLNELAKFSKNARNSEHCIISGIIRYLYGLKIMSYSFESLRLQLKMQKVTLILDSVDEAIVSYNWIIFELRRFADNYERCQIITSSRYTVNDLGSIGFVNVSLLPFNQAQKVEFFEKWFSKDIAKAQKLIAHLDAHPKLNSVVTNPLSATIMATLQESNIPLPKTEASLYHKRFQLLSGLFDQFKGINRSVEQPAVLLEASYHLAYEMHKMGKRSLSKKNMILIVSSEIDTESDAKKIVEELIFPAEMILLEVNGEYSFGHLRFQEYLASQQLVITRNANIPKIIIDEWWHDVFILYSQHAHSINWLISEISDKDSISKVVPLFKLMIKNRRDNEQVILSREIEAAIMEEKEGIFEFDGYDMFEDEDYDRF